jgi:primosomal protein N' (replication factor Y)
MQQELHPVDAIQTYVQVVLPLAVPKPYTYAVPEEWISDVEFGKRVEVQFGKAKRYSGVIVSVINEPPEQYRPKPIVSVIDEAPIITERQWQLWQWIADYYLCTIGEVMNAALPANLKLASETILTLSPLFGDDFSGLSDQEYLIAEALTIQEEITIDDVRGILQRKSVYPLIRSMLDKRILYLKEDIKEKYKPKTVSCVQLAEPYRSQPELLQQAFEQVSRANRQTEALMAYVQVARQLEFVRRQDIYAKANVDSTVLKAMEKKGIFELYEREVSRLGSYEEDTIEAHQLSEQQVSALAEVKAAFAEKKPALLHGVTGSGKTRVYIELMQEAIDRGEQVLYLLPEIALTTQIVSRLEKVFGDQIAVYHSRLNNNERVELWNRMLNGQSAVLGARSALFLPFKQLGLIVVDEEHDNSFKQYDPNPRYNARDTAVFLAHLHQCPIVLGTATPSLESAFNAKAGKYKRIHMPERFGGLQMPEIVIVDAKKELKERKLQSHFTSVLIEELKAALERGEQAILFQNRRGFSPVYRCVTCGWHAECINCDVSLTYHKFHNNLRCHYCGYQINLPPACPACGDKRLSLQGFGTEKIEDELKIYLPDAQIARMDLDTVRGKYAHARLINEFEEGRIDILVGTQMVTKGLDFEKVGVVGVLSADQLLQFPDFRATERAFQLMLQVSGRAGRKHKRGKVIIQAFNTDHPVLREVFEGDYPTFYSRETAERQRFRYPPYLRLIRITLKHRQPQRVNEGARLYEKEIKKRLGDWVMGPAMPYVGRVRNYYLLDFMVKIPRDAKKLQHAKAAVQAATEALQNAKGLSGVRVSIDVDPY